MIKILKIIFLTFSIVLFTAGCTHKIDITPKSGSGEAFKEDVKMYSVGYYLSMSDRNRYVVSPGGGGDSIGYYPYKDLELGFREILLNNFEKVYRVKKMDDKSYIEEKRIRYVFTYDVSTTSSSSNIMTWPPENFTVTLSCDAFDNEGNKIWNDSVEGRGIAAFADYKTDFPVAGRRANRAALDKMFFKIKNNKKF